MSKINFGKTLSLKQAGNLILRTPKVRYMLEGEPGIGKSSLLGWLESQLPTHNTAYIDVPNMDLGDIAMPVIDREAKVTSYYPNSRFRLTEGKPVVIMLDEYSKGSDPVKNMLHPLLEVHKPRLGDMFLEDDSIVFLTGNLSSDGVGDVLKAHTRAGRVVCVRVRKPGADEWIEWALNHDVDPIIMACVKQFPQMLASYMDEGNETNHYIYNPRVFQPAFVTPRSLQRASDIIVQRDHLDQDTLICALSGAVGEPAARDMQAFIEYHDQLPSMDEVLDKPAKAKLPKGAGATSLMVFSMVAKTDKDTLAPFMKYAERLNPEWQACFCISVARSPKQVVAFKSEDFKNWMLKNQDIIAG